MTSRTFGLMAIVVLTLAGCSGASNDAKGTASPTPSNSNSGAASGGICTSSSAKSTRGLTVKGGKFDVTCAKVAKGKQLFITNGDGKKATVATAAGAPAAFTVDLPKRTSTYAWTPKKAGTYTLTVKPGSGKATVVVV